MWNLDELKIGMDDYKQGAVRILGIYKEAYEDEEDLDSKLPSHEELVAFVEDLVRQHGKTSRVRFRRALMSAFNSVL